jgi:ring-1,2-phenylacetyl-CoA epoxidase subunit PaaA
MATAPEDISAQIDFDSLDPAEAQLLRRIHAGELIEDMDELTPRYRAVLEKTLTIAAQGEVTVLTWAYTGYDKCPDLGAKIAISASIQDEVGHAHQQGMLLERFGVSMQEKAFNEDPMRYISFPIMEFPVRSYIEFVVMQALLDRSGRYTTWDIELHCSFAPYRRALKKVNFEEAFHFRHGAYWTEYYWNHSEETRQAVQDAIDWTFPWGYQWYGRPDRLKSMNDQLIYQVRKWTNDTMRNKWLQNACKWLSRLDGAKFPAHLDEETRKWVINEDHPVPMVADNEAHEWVRESCGWDDMINSWKRGGPMRPSAYERLQREEWGDALWQA